MEKKEYLKITFTFFIFALLAIIPQFTNAATLYFSPSSGTHSIGTTFSVSVYVSSANQAMNAASGTVSFPSDKLEVTSISKNNSIFSLWVQEPTFSNSIGTVDFEGIVFNPGFTGTGGRIITINFRTKTAGNTSLSFSSSSVLANDGQGTNILAKIENANFQIGFTDPIVPETIIPHDTAGTPKAPTINSPTHPDSNKWYAVKDARFTWDLPTDVSGVRLLVGRISNAIPTVTYIPPIRERYLDNFEDGIWYFSARLLNSTGWGEVSRFRFQIDTEKPTRFDITETPRIDLTEPNVKFVFDAEDRTSGISHFEVQIGDASPQIWQDDGSGIYETPILEPGKHILIAKAVDKAGNFLENSTEFEIQALKSPIIKEYPKQLSREEPLIIKGTTKYPNAQTVIWFESEGKELKSQIVRNDASGNFTLLAEEKLKEGIYKIWAEVVDERGARSKPSKEITISIDSQAFLKLGPWAVSLFALKIFFVVLIFIILFVIWYSRYKFIFFRKKIKNNKKEADEAKLALHKAFDLLKEDIYEQVKTLKKTRTNHQAIEEGEKIIKRLRKNLDDTEKFIRKKIEDIEK